MTNPPALVTIDASEGLDKINEIIARDGGVIVSNFMSKEDVADIMSAIEPHFRVRSTYKSTSTHKELGKDFFPEGSVRIYGLLSRIPDHLVKIVRSPIWQGIMARFLK